MLPGLIWDVAAFGSIDLNLLRLYNPHGAIVTYKLLECYCEFESFVERVGRRFAVRRPRMVVKICSGAAAFYPSRAGFGSEGNPAPRGTMSGFFSVKCRS